MGTKKGRKGRIEYYLNLEETNVIVKPELSVPLESYAPPPHPGSPFDDPGVPVPEPGIRPRGFDNPERMISSRAVLAEKETRIRLKKSADEGRMNSTNALHPDLRSPSIALDI
jgi:hypothetical protein